MHMKLYYRNVMKKVVKKLKGKGKRKWSEIVKWKIGEREGQGFGSKYGGGVLLVVTPWAHHSTLFLTSLKSHHSVSSNLVAFISTFHSL